MRIFQRGLGPCGLIRSQRVCVEGIKDPLQALILPNDAGIYLVVAHRVIHQRHADFRLPYLYLVNEF